MNRQDISAQYLQLKSVWINFSKQQNIPVSHFLSAFILTPTYIMFFSHFQNAWVRSGPILQIFRNKYISQQNVYRMPYYQIWFCNLCFRRPGSRHFYFPPTVHLNDIFRRLHIRSGDIIMHFYVCTPNNTNL